VVRIVTLEEIVLKTWFVLFTFYVAYMLYEIRQDIKFNKKGR